MPTYFDTYTKRPRSPRDAAWFEYDYRQRWRAFAGSTFLDVGFGAGYFMRTAPAGVRVVGLDRDAGALRASAGWCRAAVGGDATRLPFRAASFDGIHCAHVIEHLTAPELLVADMARVLRPGGVAMIRTPDVARAGFRFFVDHTHRRPFTVQSLRGLLALHGFGDFCIGHGPFRTTRIEQWLERLVALPVPVLWTVKMWLGQRWNDELVCVARRVA
jgi:SAM-dependent methyltransferase